MYTDATACSKINLLKVLNKNYNRKLFEYCININLYSVKSDYKQNTPKA